MSTAEMEEEDDKVLFFGLSVVTEIICFLGKYAIIQLSTIDTSERPLFWIPTDLLNIPPSRRNEANRARKLFSIVLTPA